VRFEPWGNLAEMGPLANTQKNLRDDGQPGCGLLCKKNPTHPENMHKNAKSNNLLKTKRILKPNYKLSEAPVYTFSLTGGEFSPLAPRQFRQCLSPV